MMRALAEMTPIQGQLGWPADSIQRSLPFLGDEELDQWIDGLRRGVRAANALRRGLGDARHERQAREG